MITYTFKIQNLYAACSPDLGVVSFGDCWDEAVNNLQDEIKDLAREAGGDDHVS